MTNKKVQTKTQIEKLFCRLCGFIAQDENELNFHYKMAHDPDPDLEYEFEPIFVDKKTYERLLYEDYLRICKSYVCVIRPRIDIEDDKSEIRRLYREYCSTCVLKKFLVEELKQNGKM